MVSPLLFRGRSDLVGCRRLVWGRQRRDDRDSVQAPANVLDESAMAAALTESASTAAFELWCEGVKV